VGVALAAGITIAISLVMLVGEMRRANAIAAFDSRRQTPIFGKSPAESLGEIAKAMQQQNDILAAIERTIPDTLECR
jgi:hypothetical protein